jgi:hypothetical protein
MQAAHPGQPHALHLSLQLRQSFLCIPHPHLHSNVLLGTFTDIGESVGSLDLHTPAVAHCKSYAVSPTIFVDGVPVPQIPTSSINAGAADIRHTHSSRGNKSTLAFCRSTQRFWDSWRFLLRTDRTGKRLSGGAVRDLPQAGRCNGTGQVLLQPCEKLCEATSG